MLDLARGRALGRLAFTMVFAAALLGATLAPARASADEAKPLPATAPAEPVLVEVAASLGVTGRLGDAASYDVTSRGGAMLGGSVWILPSRRFSLGLAYEHVGLGREHAEIAPSGYVDVSRGLHALWLEIELYALRTDTLGLFVVLGPGLGVEHASAAGLAPTLDPLARPLPFQCSGSDAPSFGLRAGLGADLALGGGAYARLAFTADSHRLSTDPVGDCIGGAGTTTVLGSSLSFGYRFDVSRYAK